MDNIRIAILDSNDNIITFMDNAAPDALHYHDDELHEYLSGSAYTFEFACSSRHDDSQYLVVGNKLSFIYREKGYYLNIVQTERDEFDVTVTAYGALLELLNEQIGAYSAESAMSFEEYVDAFGFASGVITVGFNEVSDKSITNEWTGTATVLSRLYSLATVFSAEIEFVTELNEDYTISQLTMNVYQEHDEDNDIQGMGIDRTDEIVLRYGLDIEGITKKSDITELYTAIRPTGTDGLTISSLDKYEYDDDGAILYQSPSGNVNIYAVQAMEQYPSNVMEGISDRYICKIWEYETDNVNMLYGQALAQLKKYCVPQVEYEVDGYFDTGIGDTVRIDDQEFNPALYLTARVTEQIRSFTDPAKDKTTFSNFRELESEIDDSLIAQMNALIEANKTYTCVITTDNGIVFKNNEGTTTLTAIVLDGVTNIVSDFTITWYKDGEELSTGESITISATDISGKSVYRFEATDDNGTVRGFYEVTVSNTSDGVGLADMVAQFGVSDSYETGADEYSDSYIVVDETEYLWAKYTAVLTDGSTINTTAYCLTDGSTRLIVNSISAKVAEIDEAYISYAEIEELVAATAVIEDLTAQVATIEEAYVSYGEFDELVAASASIGDLTAQVATIEDAYISTATVNTLLADYATIEYLTANYTTTTNLVAGYASIDYLKTYYTTTTDLAATYATINTLESNYATIATLRTNYLTATEIETNYLTASEIATQYLTTDFANISQLTVDTEAVWTLLATIGIITNLTTESGYFTGELNAVTISADYLTSGTIDAAEIDVVNLNCANLTVGTINGTQIAAGTIDTTNLSSDITDAITNAQETADGKNTAYYATSAPSGSDYSTGDMWFDTDDGNALYYWNGSAWTAAEFGTDAIAASAITAEKIAASAITAGKIASGAVTTDSLAAGAVTTATLAANAVTAAKIASGTITATQIASNTITGSNLVSGTITATQIASSAITTDKIAANAITTAKIAASAITATQIASGAVTAAKIDVDYLSAIAGDVGTLTAGILQSSNYVANTSGVQIDLDNGTIDCASLITTATQTMYDGMSVGGRNYLRGTSTAISKSTTATSSFVTTYCYTTADSSPTSDAPSDTVYTLEELGFVSGDEVTLSFDWEISDASTYGNFRVEWYGTTSSSSFAYISAIKNPVATFSSSNTSGHFEITVTLTSTTINAKGIRFRIDNSYLTLTISNAKLEKGNIATDWSPAPEDTEYTTSTLSTSISQNASAITAEATRASGAEEALAAADTKYGTCSTAAGTAAKVVTCSSFTSNSLAAGAVICVYFTYANTAASPTLNVNSTGAKSIYAYGAVIASGSNYNWTAKSYVTFIYNGSQWCMVDSAASAKIQVLADSISLSVTGSLGNSASIVLSANGVDTTSTLDLSGVRQAFVNDTTAVTISAGTVTFSSNTFVVSSTYFSVTASGVVKAYGAEIFGNIYLYGGLYLPKADIDESDNASDYVQVAYTTSVSDATWLHLISTITPELETDSLIVDVSASFAAVTINGTLTTRAVLPSTTTTYNLGSSTYRYNYVYARYLNISSTGTISGTLTTAALTPSSTDNYNIGTSSLRYNYVYANVLNLSSTATISGTLITADLTPSSTTTYNIGTSSLRYNYVYAQYLNISSTATISGALTAGGVVSVGSVRPSASATYNIGTSTYKYANGYFSTSVYVGDSSYNSNSIELAGNTPYIDFHYASSTEDYTHRIIASSTGNLVASPGISSSSDARLKDCIVDLPEAYIALFDALTLREYRFIKGNNLHIGVIAQEVMDAEDELGITESVIVSGSGEILDNGDIDYYAVDYNAILIMACAKIKQLEAQIVQLQASA